MDIRPQQPPTSSQQHGSPRVHRGIVRMISLPTLVVFILAIPLVVQAKTFQCRGGDVACLITAINQANAQPGKKHEIRLAAGTYTLTAVNNESADGTGLPSITKDITIRGAGASTTIVERASDRPVRFRLWYVAAPGTLRLEGVTVRNGVVDQGGGLFNDGGSVFISRSTFTRNLAGYGGGAIYNFRGTVSISQTFLIDNDADGGGGLFNWEGSVTINQSTIAENNGHVGGGGGLFNLKGTVSLANSTIARNSDISGGGAGVMNNGGSATLTNVTLTQNQSSSADNGGGLLNADGTVPSSTSPSPTTVRGL
jgi:hypothetical protein